MLLAVKREHRSTIAWGERSFSRIRTILHDFSRFDIVGCRRLSWHKLDLCLS
jgi:hypothetical protein